MNGDGIKTGGERWVIGTLIAVLIMTLYGCEEEREAKSPYKSQVVAKVNGEEITIHQLNTQINQVNREDFANLLDQQFKNKVLDAIVIEKVAIQAAKKAQLDRDPVVLSEMEQAKNRALIKHYLKNRLNGVIEVTEAQIEGYYTDNPQLYKHRKQFDYLNIWVPLPANDQVQFLESLKLVKTEAELGSLMQTLKDKPIIRHELAYSESLPGPTMQALNALKVNDIGYAAKEDGVLVYFLKHQYEVPLSLTEARPLIKKQLEDYARQVTIKAMIKNMRQSAVVEYEPGYGAFKPNPQETVLKPQETSSAPQEGNKAQRSSGDVL